MAETKIEITVSGDNAVETLAAISADLPEGAEVVAQDKTPATAADLISDGFQASTGLSERVSEWFSSTDMQPLQVLVICLAILVGAYLVERLAISIFEKRTVIPPASPVPGKMAVRWGMMQLLRLGIFLLVSFAGFAIAFPTAAESSELARVVLASVMLPRVWYVILEVLTGSRDAGRRPSGLTNTEANKIMRYAIWLLVLLCFSLLVREFVVTVVDAGDAGALFAVACRIIDGVAAAGFFIAVRKPLGRLIVVAFAQDPSEPGHILSLMQRFWPALYIVLLFLQIAAEARGYLSGTLGEGSGALKRSFTAFVLFPFALAGLGLWRDSLIAGLQGSERGRIQGVFSLLDGVLIVGTGVFIMYAWDIDPFATDLTGAKRILPGLVSAAIVLVIGISVWRTASALLDDGKGAFDSDSSVPDDEGGAAGSRIETVLPVLRAVSAAFIGTLTVLLALSSLGVEIAPLLAGAGILGLAIGFGAQKVVEDVISGVLYLVEDAFRKGEYIETPQGKGVVEAIMLRSVRLRHHLGPVYTIPFSSMGTIKNDSRDWVTMKLSFEVAPDQDLEKVRKLIKKVGVQLMEDPELEGRFLAPLKSQGAVALVGANYKIGVKFTSEPGKQFLIRRKALNAIQNAFRENNVQLAAPRVLVDNPEQAAAAAAKLVSDMQSQETSKPTDDR